MLLAILSPKEFVNLNLLQWLMKVSLAFRVLKWMMAY